MTERNRPDAHRDSPTSVPPHTTLNRDAVFARDAYCCVYCGTEGTPDTLSVDHVQPRVRGGDHSAGNVVTACLPCNARKAHRRHTEFLASEPESWQSFKARAPYVWPRHLEAVEMELKRREKRHAQRHARRDR